MTRFPVCPLPLQKPKQRDPPTQTKGAGSPECPHTSVFLIPSVSCSVVVCPHSNLFLVVLCILFWRPLSRCCFVSRARVFRLVCGSLLYTCVVIIHVLCILVHVFKFSCMMKPFKFSYCHQSSFFLGWSCSTGMYRSVHSRELCIEGGDNSPGVRCPRLVLLGVGGWEDPRIYHESVLPRRSRDRRKCRSFVTS